MMNPIALAAVVFGILLLVIGLILVARHRRAAGIAFSVLGLGIMAVRFIITILLFG